MFHKKPTWAALIYLCLCAEAACVSQANEAAKELPAVSLAPQCPPPADQATLALGQKVYGRVCASCHQADGRGLTNIFPPLTGHAPRLAQTAAGQHYLAHLVLWGLTGPITVDGHVYQNAMPPQASLLKDDEIAAVLSYVMQSFDNCRAFSSMPSFAQDDIRRLRQIGASGRDTFVLRQSTEFSRPL